MNLTPAAMVLGLPVAALVGLRSGGTMGVGVMAGYLAGACVGLLGFSWGQLQLKRDAQRWMASSLAVFMAILAGALIGTLSMQSIDVLAEVVDWRSFLISYAVSAYASLLLGALDGRRMLQQETAS